MKNTTKTIALAIAAVAILFTSNVKAQTVDQSAWRLGFGIEGGIPTGSNIRSFSHAELGGTARLQYGIAKNIGLTLTSGYYNLFKRSGIEDDAKDLGIVPVKVGAKIFFAQSIYFGAEVGAGFETQYDKNTKFIYTPGLGWANKSWDVGVRYEGFAGQSDNYGFVALRLAYGFAL